MYNVSMGCELLPGEVLEELFGEKKIIQNVNLYRFTSDSVLLSKFVKRKKGDADGASTNTKIRQYKATGGNL